MSYLDIIRKIEERPESEPKRLLPSEKAKEPAPLEEQSRPEACHCCHSFRFWESVHRAVACATCHPPVQLALVVRWLNGKQ